MKALGMIQKVINTCGKTTKRIYIRMKSCQRGIAALYKIDLDQGGNSVLRLMTIPMVPISTKT